MHNVARYDMLTEAEGACCNLHCNVSCWQAMTQEEQLRDAVFLLFANKQDLPNACPASKLVRCLVVNCSLRVGDLHSVMRLPVRHKQWLTDHHCSDHCLRHANYLLIPWVQADELDLHSLRQKWCVPACSDFLLRVLKSVQFWVLAPDIAHFFQCRRGPLFVVHNLFVPCL